MSPWTPKFTKADLDPNRVIGFSNKTNFRVICLFNGRAVDSEWTHMWLAATVNNDGRTDYLRLSHLTALPAGVNNHLRCIHKGLTAFLRVTPPIQMTIKQFNTIFWFDVQTSDASGSWLPVVLNRRLITRKKAPWVGFWQLTCHCLHIVRND